MVCDTSKQDSNKVGLFLTKNVDCALPVPATFETREPNTFDSFGAAYTKVTRAPFNPSRQNKKGGTSDLDVTGGWNEDVTQNNMPSLMSGLFFAAPHVKSSQTNVAINADEEFVVASEAGFADGDIILASGMTISTNNGPKHITATAAGLLTVSEAITAEDAAATKSVMRVGRQFAAGEASLSVIGGMAALTLTTTDPSTLDLDPAEWVFVGGDLAAAQFGAVKPFYARINSIDAANKIIYFDKTTSTIVADNGAAKTVEIYFGFYFKNEEDEDLIVSTMYTAERPLGNDGDGTQSDSISNFMINTLKWNSPLSNKVTVDIAGIGLGYKTRTGADGLISKEAGNVVTKALGEDPFNTSVNVYRMRFAISDPTVLNGTPLFARATEWTGSYSNNVTASKGQGSLGGFDFNVGQFDVSISVTAYFQYVAAITTIEENTDCTFDAIYAANNAGIIHDYPLLSTGGGQLTIAQNQPIMMPLTGDASESEFGHTAMIAFFPYLPTAAMPSLA